MKLSLTFFAIISICFLACRNSADKLATEQLTGADITLTDTTYQMQQLPPEPKQEDQVNGNKTSNANYDWDKKIVKTANLHAEVKDYFIFSKSLRDKVKKHGGYISNEQESTNEYSLQNTIVVKVPVQHFDNAVADILAGANKVTQKQITSEDVTSEFVDGKAKLEAKKQVRLKYLELLQKAKNMSEIIDVQKEINAIQEEIELVNGRINYLSHSSAMSTIHFTYEQILHPLPSGKEGGFITRLKDAFSFGWKWMGEILISIISIWPLVLITVIIFLAVRKKLVLRWNKKAVL